MWLPWIKYDSWIFFTQHNLSSHLHAIPQTAGFIATNVWAKKEYERERCNMGKQEEQGR